MNDLTRLSRSESNAPARIARLFALQHAAFQAAPYPAASERLAKLKALKKQIRRYQDLLAEAMNKDFGSGYKYNVIIEKAGISNK